MRRSNDDPFVESLSRCLKGSRGKNSVTGKVLSEVSAAGFGPAAVPSPAPRRPLRDIKSSMSTGPSPVGAGAQAAMDTSPLKAEVQQILQQFEGLIHRLKGVLKQL